MEPPNKVPRWPLSSAVKPTNSSCDFPALRFRKRRRKGKYPSVSELMPCDYI